MNLADKYLSKARKIHQQENQTKIEYENLTKYLNPKKQYNVLLNQMRLIEQAFKNKQLTITERENRIEVYRAIIEVLDMLLQEIREIEPVSHEEAVSGFKLIH